MTSIYNLTRETLIASRVPVAKTFLSRMIGLLGKDRLKSDEGLLITRCNSIHMLFMRFALDVIFVDDQKTVTGLLVGIKPFQLSRIFWKANCAIELPVGTITRTKTQLGDKLSFSTS